MLMWQNNAFSLGLTNFKHLGKNVTIGVNLLFRLTKGGSKNLKKKKKKSLGSFKF
jgi:hypothetical protein